MNLADQIHFGDLGYELETGDYILVGRGFSPPMPSKHLIYRRTEETVKVLCVGWGEA